MNITRASTLTLAVVLLTAIVGCSQSFLRQGDEALKKQSYQQALVYYEQALHERPGDPQVQRALGQVYYYLRDYDQAEKLLKAAQARIPKDGAITLYLGMIAETKNDFAGAAEFYAKFLAANSKSPLAPQIKGRLLYVQNEQMRKQVAEAVKNETSLASQTPTENTIGVLPFRVPDKAGEDVNSLAQGMAAALWYDLASVKELQVVERLQLKYLTDELAAADKGFVAKNSGPRLGKFVKAQHLVTANLDSPAADKLSIQTGLINTGAGSYSPAFAADDQFSKAMKVQKQMTLAVLDSLGIKLSGSVRHELKKSPTDSYSAFLAFSRGVDQFDRGEYGKADAFFVEAARIDPSFDLAKEFHDQAQLLQVGSADLQRFSGVVLAGTSAQPANGDRLGSELLNLSNPDADPRHQDLPTTTVGTGSATVSGSVR
ncbi:MAG: tetratricopeptide repeat protein [candidate division Zixibacteria bacterium]|nr:tetratricopeptide repeat protein [candidate division Zixibacteria bacterium]